MNDTRPNRFTVMLSDSELARIDAFRATQTVPPNRSDVVRQAIREWLDSPSALVADLAEIKSCQDQIAVLVKTVPFYHALDTLEDAQFADTRREIARLHARINELTRSTPPCPTT